MKTKVPMERFGWSLNDISNRTGLSRSFLRNEVRSGRLPVRRFGRRVIVLDEDLEKYLTEGSAGGKPDGLASQPTVISGAAMSDEERQIKRAEIFAKIEARALSAETMPRPTFQDPTVHGPSKEAS